MDLETSVYLSKVSKSILDKLDEHEIEAPFQASVLVESMFRLMHKEGFDKEKADFYLNHTLQVYDKWCEMFDLGE